MNKHNGSFSYLMKKFEKMNINLNSKYSYENRDLYWLKYRQKWHNLNIMDKIKSKYQQKRKK